MVNVDSTMRRAILISIALIVIAIILPIGLAYISASDNRYIDVPGVEVPVNETTNQTLSYWIDPAIITLLTILLPILVVVAIILYFIPKIKNRGM